MFLHYVIELILHIFAAAISFIAIFLAAADVGFSLTTITLIDAMAEG